MKALPKIPQFVLDENPQMVEVIFKGPKGTAIRDLATLHGPNGGYSDLSYSYWELNETEKQAIATLMMQERFPLVELTIVGAGHPPVAINVIVPE